MRPPEVKSFYFPLGGGLDLLTPAIQMQPGKVFDSQNYEPEVSGGYRRVDGYERVDGRTSPTGGSYYLMTATITGSVSVGNTITGGTSGATAYVLLVTGSTLVVTAVTGTFMIAEALKVATVTQATSTSTAMQTAAVAPSDDADYALLAANYYRSLITAVPGSGPIRGVWVYKDVLYAFRDNAGATAGLMYKATGSGWTQITFGSEILFTASTAVIFAGDTITGGTSGATATVVVPVLRTGTWTVAGAGSLVITPIAGTFISGEAIKVGGVSKATSSSVSYAITRLPGGSMEFDNGNFVAQTTTTNMYGVDGVNCAFEFDGTTYVPIHSGMTADTPAHVRFHKTSLFLSFRGSVQFSALGNPYSWTVLTGAGEIACGDPVTGFLPQGGTAAGSSLAIFTGSKTHILYGNSSADFKLVTSVYDLGYYPFTCQQISNDAFGMTARGVQKLIATLSYGDFDYSSVSHLIQPLVSSYRGLEVASTTIRYKNQYRVYWSNGYGLVIGSTGDQTNGCMMLNYANPVTCYTTAILTNGTEVSYFGSTNGMVYQDNIGTSQDGENIEAWIRPVFNNLKSPQIIKRYRRATFEVKNEGYAKVNLSYDLGYAGPDAQPSALRADTAMVGAGSYWDVGTWDQCVWDSPIVNTQTISIEGSAKNISFLFYSNRAQDKSHTIQGVTVNYTPRRIGRMDN